MVGVRQGLDNHRLALAQIGGSHHTGTGQADIDEGGTQGLINRHHPPQPDSAQRLSGPEYGQFGNPPGLDHRSPGFSWSNGHQQHIIRHCRHIQGRAIRHRSSLHSAPAWSPVSERPITPMAAPRQQGQATPRGAFILGLGQNAPTTGDHSIGAKDETPRMPGRDQPGLFLGQPLGMGRRQLGTARILIHISGIGTIRRKADLIEKI